MNNERYYLLTGAAGFLGSNICAQLLAEGKAKVKVLESADKWYGVTYAEDKPVVVAALQQMTQDGLYPDGLWG